MENLFNQEMATKLYGKEMKEEERLIAIKKMAEMCLKYGISRDKCLMDIIEEYPNVEQAVVESIVDQVY